MQISEIKVSYTPKVKSTERPVVRSSGDAYAIFIGHWDKGAIQLREESKLLLLSRTNRVLGLFTLSVGGTGSTVVDPRLIFAIALKTLAASLVLCHNHPSGQLFPSEGDKAITKRLLDGGRLLGLEFLDHLIITEEGFYSFLDEGLL